MPIRLRLFVVAAIVSLSLVRTTDSISTSPWTTHSNLATPSSRFCTSIGLNNNGYAIFGTNMDWLESDAGLIYINKRGLEKWGHIPSTDGQYAHWIAKYGSITFNLVAYQIPWAGINENGLIFSTMSGRPWTVDEPPDERPPLDSGQWFQYVLDTRGTVDEMLEAFSEVRSLTYDHYLVSDREGNYAVLEFIGGRPIVHRGEGLPVAALSNTAYTEALSNWYNKQQSLPWNSSDGSIARFVTAADRVDRFDPTDTYTAIGYAFDTLRAINGELFSRHTSQWSIVFDAENLRAYFRTARHPQIRYVDLATFDLSCASPVKMLNIQQDLTGNVSGAFFDFNYDISVDLYRSFCANWGIWFTSQELANRIRFFAGYECRPKEAY